MHPERSDAPEARTAKVSVLVGKSRALVAGMASAGFDRGDGACCRVTLAHDADSPLGGGNDLLVERSGTCALDYPMDQLGIPPRLVCFLGEAHGHVPVLAFLCARREPLGDKRALCKVLSAIQSASSNATD